jgi:tRNA-dihydrouridine synthase A
MMDWTDRHYRYFIRRLTRCTLLYTEMITAAAIVHGDQDRLLSFHPEEHPLSLQLGGDDPDQLAHAIEIAESYGYDEYNLNVGCPSDRVQNGNFGACLMADPPHVARLARTMLTATTRPVTIKHRIGIEGRATYEDMLDFVDTVAAVGVDRFTVHARIAILEGLSPKENRSIPPLRYDDVYRLKKERPELEVEINGEVKSIDGIRHHLNHVDAVMIGRAAYANPTLLAVVDREFFHLAAGKTLTRESVAREMKDYLQQVVDEGRPPRSVLNHMLGLFAGRPGARYWKRALSGRLPEIPAPELLERALEEVPVEIRRERLDFVERSE